MEEKDKKKDISPDLTQAALQAIRRMMFHNEIVPGTKLAYRDLAKRLNMSPTPVSNALKYLEIQGLVRKEHNKGYYTEPISVKEIKEIYDFREQIEVSLLRETIERLDDRGVEKFQKAFDASMESQNAPFIGQRITKDVHFHLTMAELSQNRTKTRALTHLFDLLYLKYGGNVLFNRYMNPANWETHFTRAESRHQLIFDAVLKRDLKEAQETLKNHIQNVRDDVLWGIERMLESKKSEMF
jgi:DNA-binding GntR family transcriptional regulator